MIANIRTLRSSTKEILSAVSRGDEILITNRGKVCAKIVPVDGMEVSEETDDKVFGLWKDHKNTKDVSQYVRKLRKPRHAR